MMESVQILNHSTESERARHMNTLSTSTYVPYLGMVLQGDMHKRDFTDYDGDARMRYASRALALVDTTKPKMAARQAAAGQDDPNSEYRRVYYDPAAIRPDVTFTAALKKQLYLIEKQKAAKNAFISGGGFASGPRAMLWAQQFQASVPAGGNDSAAQVVGPLTQIPFIQDVLGYPNQKYFINRLTTQHAIPQLHAEMPETDYSAPLLQLEPTQYAEQIRPDFDSHFFHAKRNEFPFILPREYRYRATIDPYNIYVRAASDALRMGREALTLLALSKLPDQKSTASFVDSAGDIPNPTADTTGGGYPAAEHNVKAFLEGLFAKFWDNTRLEIDSVVMNPVDFVNYESNFFTMGWQGYKDVSDWGIVQLPGFKRAIRTAISPFCPKGVAYFFVSDYVNTGNGPNVTETWAKPEANSDAGAYRDYVDIRVFNAKRAGFKALITGSANDFNGEITTLAKARDLIKPPEGLLEKDR